MTSRYLFFSLFVLIQLVVCAQQDESKTKLQSSLSKKGNIVVYESIPLGSVKGGHGTANVIAVCVYVIGNEKNKTKGVEIAIKEESASLDYEEIDVVINALTYFIDSIKKWVTTPPTKETMMVFTTKDKFSITCLYRTDKSVYYIGIDGKTSGSMSVDANQLSELKTTLEKSIQTLKNM